MHKFHHCRGVAVAATILAAFAAVTDVGAADPAAVMVIIDGSGSMAGRVEGGGTETKINLVRAALRSALGQVGPRSRIGLASLGAAPRSCGAVDVIRTPEPVDVEAMMSQLDRIRPRGRGPLTLAVREVAKLLPKQSGPRSLVLIHDDADNCRPDLCAAAAELSAAGVTAHVVSIGAAPEDLAKMACLPQETGGRHFKAQTAGELAAFIGEAVRLAGSDMAVAGFTTTVVPPVPVPASGPTALYLRAVLAPDTKPLNVPLHWTVSAEGRPDAAVFEAWAANPVAPVKPGRYVVEAGNGLISARGSVVVRENRPVALPVTLGAGVVRVRPLAHRTRVPLADAIVTISKGEGADALPVAVFRAGETAALLPAGRFTVRAELGLVRSEPRILDVAAGRSAAVEIPLDVGRLQLTIGGGDGAAPLKAPLFIVTEDDPPRGRREVARSAARQADFVLPPGTYYVIARQGDVEAHQRLEVGSGDVVRHTLTVPAGRLSLSATGAGASPLDDDLVSYTIRRIDEHGHDTIDTSRPAPVLFLSSGRYRVEGRYGLTNVQTVREIDIRAGEDVQLSLEHQIATLKLRHAGPAKHVSWEVRDRSGRTVWAGDGTEAVATLQAGRYVVAARTGGRREERAVELPAGASEVLRFRGD